MKKFKQLCSWIAKNLNLQAVNNHSLVKRLAFTLAEVLITLAIIGVVAGLTIPTLLANTNEKGLNTADSVFQRRLGEALKVMNLQGTLADHETTQEFVDELSRHMKIIKTCPSDKLTECFVSEFTSGTETIDVSKLKASKNLYKTTDYGTETIGVVFGNGIRALIAYNKNATQDQFDNSNTTSPVRLTSSGTGKNAIVSLSTDSLSILYNLQERRNNNVYSSTGNIRGKNILLSTSNCFATTASGLCIAKQPQRPRLMDASECHVAESTFGLKNCCDDTNYIVLMEADCSTFGPGLSLLGSVAECGGVDKMFTKAELIQIASEIYGESTSCDSNVTKRAAALGLPDPCDFPFVVFAAGVLEPRDIAGGFVDFSANGYHSDLSCDNSDGPTWTLCKGE